jgi:hypothetical protein
MFSEYNLTNQELYIYGSSTHNRLICIVLLLDWLATGALVIQHLSYLASLKQAFYMHYLL